MFIVSEFSGNVYKNGIKIPLDDTNDDFKEFLIQKENNNVTFVEYFGDEIDEILNKKNEDIETILYLKRIDDAKQIWARLSARFRIKKQQGVLDDATENIILAELKPVLDIVVPFGQWITGQNLLIQIGDSVIGSELYNELFQIFDNYIQQNYSPIEIENSKISQEKK